MLVGLETVHCDKQLVERLLALVVAAAHARAALTTDRVDLVDKHDTGHVLFGLVKQIAHSRRAHADKHFHKVRAGLAEKRHVRFARNGFGKQGLARSGRSDQKHAVRHARADRGKLLRVFKELDNFFKFLFFFLRARNVREPHFKLVLHVGFGLAEVHCGLGGIAHRAEHEDHKHDKHQQTEYGYDIVGYGRGVTIVKRQNYVFVLAVVVVIISYNFDNKRVARKYFVRDFVAATVGLDVCRIVFKVNLNDALVVNILNELGISLFFITRRGVNDYPNDNPDKNNADNGN